MCLLACLSPPPHHFCIAPEDIVGYLKLSFSLKVAAEVVGGGGAGGLRGGGRLNVFP